MPSLGAFLEKLLIIQLIETFPVDIETYRIIFLKACHWTNYLTRLFQHLLTVKNSY